MIILADFKLKKNKIDLSAAEALRISRLCIKTMFKIVRKFTFTILLPFYFAISMMIISPAYIVQFISIKITNKLSEIWIYYTLILLRLVAIKKIRLHYNPEILFFKKSLLISNHVNYFDWLVIWASLLILKKKNITFNVKKSLSKIYYIFGRTKMLNFVFLRRKLDYDYITIVDACNKLKKLEEYTDIIFPEGTLITHKKSKQLNFKRCKDRQINPPLKHVMVPKTTGFEIKMSQLKKDLDGIIDCTLCYDNPTKFKIKNLILGKANRITVDIYLDKAVLDLNTECKNWLINLYIDKNKKFEKINGFDNNKLKTIEIETPKIYKLFLKFGFSNCISNNK